MKHPKHPNTSKHLVPRPLNPLKGTCSATANETERGAKVIDSTNPNLYKRLKLFKKVLIHQTFA